MFVIYVFVLFNSIPGIKVPLKYLILGNRTKIYHESHPESKKLSPGKNTNSKSVEGLL
jgi:hypothetical protein